MIGGLSPGGDCARIYFDFVRREPIASDFDKRMGSLMSILLQNPLLLGSMGKRAKVIYAFEHGWGLKGEQDRDG
jgi:hypothetical protein